MGMPNPPATLLRGPSPEENNLLRSHNLGLVKTSALTSILSLGENKFGGLGCLKDACGATTLLLA